MISSEKFVVFNIIILMKSTTSIVFICPKGRKEIQTSKIKNRLFPSFYFHLSSYFSKIEAKGFDLHSILI